MAKNINRFSARHEEKDGPQLEKTLRRPSLSRISGFIAEALRPYDPAIKQKGAIRIALRLFQHRFTGEAEAIFGVSGSTIFNPRMLYKIVRPVGGRFEHPKEVTRRDQLPAIWNNHIRDNRMSFQRGSQGK